MEHEMGCPAIADDESDYEYLCDAGECTCEPVKWRARAEKAEQQVATLTQQLAEQQQVSTKLLDAQGQRYNECITLTEQIARLTEALTDAERIAQMFHEAYERLAPSFGYETRRESRKPWADVPEQNKQLMIAVAREVGIALAAVRGEQHP